MRGWYRPRDLLAAVPEHVIPETSTAQETADVILADTQLLRAVSRISSDGGHALTRAT
jgi:hypothetical protein